MGFVPFCRSLIRKSIAGLDADIQLVMRRVFLLPVVLASFLIIGGLFGVYVSKKINNELLRLRNVDHNSRLGCAEITANLIKLSLNILRLDRAGIAAEPYKLVIEESQILIKKLDNDIQAQRNFSKDNGFDSLIGDVSRDWGVVQKKLSLNLTEDKLIHSDLSEMIKSISSLAGKTRDLENQVEVEFSAALDSGVAFSKTATRVFQLTVIVSSLIGLFLSSIFIKSVCKIFGLIAKSKRDVEILLNNLDQGYLIFNKNGIIEPGVSKAAKLFFGVDPTGLGFHEVLPVSSKSKEAALAWQKLIYGGMLNFSDFRPLAPQYFEHNGRYISLDFKPIYLDGSSKLNKTICIASDRTRERKLAEKADNETTLTKLIVTVLSDRGSFIEHVRETRKIFKEIESDLFSVNPSLDLIFRGLHSLKAGAAAFNLVKINRDTHRLENALAEIRVKGGDSFTRFLPELKTGVAEVQKNFEGFLFDNKAIIGEINEDEERSKKLVLNKIYDFSRLVYRLYGPQSQVYSQFVENFVQEDLGLAFKRFESQFDSVAESQFKKVEIKIELAKVKVYLDPYVPLVSSFIHVFRNSIDHGIEDQETRSEVGKPEIGTISIQFRKITESPDGYPRIRITIKDDGRGIDPEVVRKKAIEKGIVALEVAQELSDRDVCQLLFRSGFSTRDTVSDLSGRGVGLDVVQYEALSLGGSAWIESVIGKGTVFYVEVPFYEAPTLATLEKIEKHRLEARIIHQQNSEKIAS